MNQSFSGRAAQANQTDYLFSVLCIICVLDLLTLPLLVIASVFWIKKKELPFLGGGFSTKLNLKKLAQILLLAVSGSAIGLVGQQCCQQLVRWTGLANPIATDAGFGKELLVAAVTGFVMELAFRRCLYDEWSRYGILPAVLGSGLLTMMLSSVPEWPGALLLGLCAAMIYQVTGCLVMTAVFHISFLTAPLLAVYSADTVVALSAPATLLLLAVGIAGCWLALKLSPNWKNTCKTIAVQQKNSRKHPYVFRVSYNFFLVVLLIFQTMPLWVGRML